MKIKFKEVRPARSRSYLKHKLISATAMLLVSSILMVSTSYAWYVLSTAPEVSNIKTQVGANGALEIALLNKDSWADLSKLDMGDIDESLTDQSEAAATVANLTWGNLVNLDDSSYGLEQITLQPSRLYIEQSGNGYKLNSVPLKTPVYGEDGRVKSLDKTSAVAYTYANGTFSDTTGYGVRAIGTAASMSVFQLGMNAARSNLVTYAAAARTAASNSLQSTGGQLANVVIAYAVSDQTTGFTNDDVAAARALAVGLQESLDQIEIALRYAFAGYITTDDAVYDAEKNPDGVITSENYQTKLAEITDMSDTGKTLSALLTEYPGITSVITNISSYIATLDTNQTKVAKAISDCDALKGGSYTWEQISAIITPLMNTSTMLVNGKTISELKAELYNTDGSINVNAAVAFMQGGITISVPTGSGLLSDVADFAGDYTAVVTVYPVISVGSITLDGTTPMDVTMTTDTTYNPVHLTDCSNGLKAATVGAAVGSNSITDYYGYAIDLAFRTNAEESDLLLQTEPQNRIYDGNTQNAALQGAGSYMSFTTSAGLSATKMVKLMSGIRVVLAEPLSDGTMEVLAIAKLDTTLGKDVYTAIKDDNDNVTGYYLDGSAGAYQNSDIITEEEYGKLDDKSKVTFNKTTGKVTAKLYIYNYEMTKRYLTDTEGNYILDEKGEKTYAYTGALTIGSKVDSGTIVSLTTDVVQKVTALVYLDGSVVNNSMVAANSAQSMSGVLNLQFSSSATLIPAEVTKLQSQTSEGTYTLMTGDLYEAGYLYYGGYLGKVNSGYAIYTDSSDKIYYATTDGSEYVELTMETAANALTFVTTVLTNTATSTAIGTSLSMTVGETVSFSAALNSTDENLVISQSGVLTVTNKVAKATLDNATQTGTIETIEAGSADLTVHLSVIVKKADGSYGTTSYAVNSQPITVTVTEATSESGAE